MEQQPPLTHEQQINHLGSFPPMVQFIGVLLGAFLDFFYPIRLIPETTGKIFGLFFLLGATAIIVWSQVSSHNFRNREKKGEARTFLNGPYRYSSNPTSFGLALLIIGLGFLLDSVIIIGAAAVGFWLSHLVYSRPKEKILEEKYQDEYREYKKKIHTL